MPRYLLGFLLLFGLVAGCAGLSPVMQEGALPPMPLADLIANASGYSGQTVVVGGYVLEVNNQQHQTQIVAIQVPMGSGQRLKSRDLSEGRLILIYDGFIDPEVYQKDRGITVRGEIMEGSDSDPEVSYPYLRIKVQELYLWPKEEPFSQKRHSGYDPFYPYPWYRYYSGWRYPFVYYPYWGSYWNYRYWR